MSNILQARILTAEGRLVSASAMDLKKTADRALQGARWNVDPTGIPATMRQAWLGVEFGDYAAVAKAVKKGLNSRKKDVKAAAEKLNAAVEAKLQEDLAAANEALAAEKKWTAFKIYSAMAAKFKGYNVPPEAAEKTKELTGDPAVQKEMQASKSFKTAARLLSSKSPASRKRAVKNLKKLIADMPLTEAARRAETILKQLGVQ